MIYKNKYITDYIMLILKKKLNNRLKIQLFYKNKINSSKNYKLTITRSSLH